MPLRTFAGIENVLVIKPSSLGDIVHTLPSVSLIKRAHPHWKISWLINPEWACLLKDNPDVHKPILFPRKKFRGLKGMPSLLRWAGQMLPIQPDLALDFQGLLRSALIAKLTRAQAIWGLSNAREGAAWFYDHTIAVDPARHAAERYLQLAHALGADIETRPLPFSLPAGEALANFQCNEPFILLHPVSRGQGKSLSAGQITTLCNHLNPWRVIIVGVSNKNNLALPKHCVNLINQTSLEQLIWLMRQAQFIISVDSGPLHIACALTPHTLGLYTWSDPAKVGPYRPDAWVWKHGKIYRASDAMKLPQPQNQYTIGGADLLSIASFTQEQLRGASTHF